MANSEKIDPKLVFELLNASEALELEGISLGDALSQTIDQLADLVEKANTFLETSPLAAIVAESLATKAHRKGRASIRISSEGQARLEVTSRRIKAPLMSELRAQAKELGVDISAFGTKRLVIHDYLRQQAEPRALKVAPELSNEDAGPMSAGPDETRVSPAPTQNPPKRKGFIKTGVPMPTTSLGPETPPQKSLRQLVTEAKDIDIASLLGSDDV